MNQVVFIHAVWKSDSMNKLINQFNSFLEPNLMIEQEKKFSNTFNGQKRKMKIKQLTICCKTQKYTKICQTGIVKMFLKIFGIWFMVGLDIREI